MIINKLTVAGHLTGDTIIDVPLSVTESQGVNFRHDVRLMYQPNDQWSVVGDTNSWPVIPFPPPSGALRTPEASLHTA